MLDEIINNHKLFNGMYGLGYKQNNIDKSSSSMMTRNEAKKGSYIDVLKRPIKKEKYK